MIELVSTDRCTACGICVKICPTDVFDGEVGEVPRIARQDQCQTCSMCEVHCPADALFVAPVTAPVAADSPWRDEAHLIATGLLGRYRELEGWGPGRSPHAARGDARRPFAAMARHTPPPGIYPRPDTEPKENR